MLAKRRLFLQRDLIALEFEWMSFGVMKFFKDHLTRLWGVEQNDVRNHQHLIHSKFGTHFNKKHFFTVAWAHEILIKNANFW